jgi:hypothetical protein
MVLRRVEGAFGVGMTGEGRPITAPACVFHLVGSPMHRV